ncbi:MAG: hypothetical protein U9O78_02065, partial [Patescibacteria group bacterium]|nr:hypothetical protein [Patescibacteria group bacterium]
MADNQELAIVIEAVNNASKKLKQVENDLKELGSSSEKQGKQALKSSDDFNNLVGAIALGNIKATIAIKVLGELVSILKKLGSTLFEVGRSASEVEMLGIAMNIVANNAGVTAKEVTKVRDAVRDQNITTQASNRLLTDLIRNQLDYKDATELATAAQNIAVASGVDSSETIERISQAISSGNTWLLRQLGMVKHLNEVYDDHAVSLGKTGKQLDEIERKQAIVNYVLEEGERYTGAYDAAMGNAAKVMNSLGRAQTEVSYILGSVFNDALFEVSNTIYQFVNDISDWGHQNEEKLKAISKRLGIFTKQIVTSIKTFIQNIPWDWLLDVMSAVMYETQRFSARIKVLANYVQILARMFVQGVRTIKDFGMAIFALQRGDFEGLKNIYTDWK